MALPLVIAYHLFWTGYGWWLPNDPRDSMSTCIRCDLIAELGELYYGRKRVQPASRDIRTFYDAAVPRLKFAQVTFASEEVEQIACAFGNVIEEQRYTCYACAIMPDHVHVLDSQAKAPSGGNDKESTAGESFGVCAKQGISILSIRFGVGRDGKCFWIRQTIFGGR